MGTPTCVPYIYVVYLTIILKFNAASRYQENSEPLYDHYVITCSHACMHACTSHASVQGIIYIGTVDVLPVSISLTKMACSNGGE